MKNIEQFDLVVSHLLGMLYQKFPEPQKLDSRQLTDRFKVADGFDWEVTPNGQGFVSDTLDHLLAEGIIRGKGSTGCYSGITLTTRGLHLLNRIPSSLQTRRTFGEQLSELTDGLESASKVEQFVQKLTPLMRLFWGE